ncbi:MAG: acyl transferase [Candidatus Moranbacteria bacterium]|nr:acyl transferase [Candidatus Moranbacteria bacterium]
MNINLLKKKIFKINSPEDFNETALVIFRHQVQNNPVYRAYVEQLQIRPERIKTPDQIPFLPIEFFKTHKVYSGSAPPDHFFESSGTTGEIRSRHYYYDLELYEQSFLKNFNGVFGKVDQFAVLGLLPSYLEQKNSSLIFMVNKLIEKSNNPHSGFYLYNYEELAEILLTTEKNEKKVILFGVSFALLDLIEKHSFNLKNTIVVETGGMKGRKREMIREELHEVLCEGFGLKQVCSEYGMTEMFSQAWSRGEGKFFTPPWLRVVIRDMHDPLSHSSVGESGGINVIDLANIHSCSFIATQDLGRINKDGSYEVLGRFDNAEVRGCNILVSR